ncbi:hypothetical protein ACGFIK_14785 [Micromonospora sp. NPDC048871]|uniref:hypothetical protein n=1 Tax=unclassified Micromonospora TaxID=2617518 RepID=UPI002E0D6589|nr:hypothetical protein OIE53_10885 [Micromonospora sp. NBC_01739]
MAAETGATGAGVLRDGLGEGAEAAAPELAALPGEPPGSAPVRAAGAGGRAD